MKINKVSDEMVAPAWAFGNKSLDEFEKNKAVLKSDVERISIIESSKVNDEVLAKECEAIEKCATSDKTYHYNSTWDIKHISHLKEYASACGLKEDKFKGADPAPLIEEMAQIEKQASDSRLVKTASKEIPKLVLADPFHIEEHANTSHMEKADWQTISKQSNLKDIPSMASGAVRPLRGGEDYFKNSNINPANNQNSISNPDAIKQLAESETIDTGARLRAENQAKIDAKKAEHAQWEKNVIDSMEKKDIVPKGRVFPTETMNAQSGLNSPSSRMGVYAKFDIKDIPEKTDGEKLKESNIQRKQAIQRPEKEKVELKMEKAPLRSISEVFGEELKKRIK